MILPLTLGAVALAFLLDGIATMNSQRYYERRQKFFRMTIKAPENVDANKYNMINRVLAGLGMMGAAVVVVFWIIQYLAA